MCIGEFNQAEVNTFVEESLKMSRFKHAHVMGLVGVCLDSGNAPLIIMPYMANGSLLKYLKRERESLIVSEENDEDEVNCIFSSRSMQFQSITSYLYSHIQAFFAISTIINNALHCAKSVIAVSLMYNAIYT